ncbi:MAG: hypothetical protein WB688_09320 [Trebonia sp.]
MRPLRMRAEATAEADQGRVIMGTLIWTNILLMLLFFGCWAGIPLWHTLRGWNDEVNAKHAELAAKAVPVLVTAQSAPAAEGMREADIPALAGRR